ncbi:MAG: PTS system mannose/fructose/sorbose family transporter subunit IID [Faecalibacillus faecis]
MGPIAGIGDSSCRNSYSYFIGIALGMSTGGSPLGAIMYIIVWNLFAYFGMKFLYFKGYELGGKAVDFLVGPQGEALRESVTMLGGIVIGAVSATWISVTTSFTMTAAGAKKPFIDLQKTLDGVYPGLLTAVFVVGCWYLLSKKKMSPIKVMLLLVVVAFIGVFVGFFNPGLSY